jgi:hypothetical protein
VWAATDLLIEPMSNWGLFELYRRRAAAIEAEKKGRRTTADHPRTRGWIQKTELAGGLRQRKKSVQTSASKSLVTARH